MLTESNPINNSHVRPLHSVSPRAKTKGFRFLHPLHPHIITHRSTKIYKAESKVKLVQ